MTFEIIAEKNKEIRRTPISLAQYQNMQHLKQPSSYFSAVLLKQFVRQHKFIQNTFF